MSGTGKGRTFTQEEVNAILSRAVERQHASSGGLTYAELLDVARQAGISPEAITAAVEDVGGSEGNAPGASPRPADADVRKEIAARAWRARRAFAVHFSVYAMVMVLLSVINWQTWDHGSRHVAWALYPILAWGVGLAAHFTVLLYGYVLPDPRAEDRVRDKLQREGAWRRRRDAALGVRVEPSVRVSTESDDDDRDDAVANTKSKAARRT